MKKTQMELDIDLRLSAQRALWGHVSPVLRSASVDVEDAEIIWKCIFDEGATEDDIELLQCAGTEIIADFPDFNIKEIMEILPFPQKTNDLRLLVYYRHEHNYYAE